jgi:hypothetical protein
MIDSAVAGTPGQDDSSSRETTVISAFLCGHSEVDMADVPNQSEVSYVFVEAPCRPACPSVADSDRELPTRSEMKEIADISYDLETALTVLDTSINKFDNHLRVHFTADEVREVVHDPFVADILLAGGEERTDMIERLCHFDLLRTTLRYSKQFARNANHRPFFVYCLNEAAFHSARNQADIERLIDALDRLSSIDYQPSFGYSQLIALRGAGRLGMEILAQPISAETVQAAEALVTDFQNGTTTTSPADDPITAWLDRLEREYLEEQAARARRAERKEAFKQVRLSIPRVFTV